MPAVITASGIAETVNNSSQITFSISDIPVSGTEVLFTCVGTIDGDRPNFLSAEYAVSGTVLDSLDLVVDNKGAGGRSYPAAFIMSLVNPPTTSGDVTVYFDEPVASMGAVGIIFSGLDTAGSPGYHLADSINPQPPDFPIETSYSTTASQLVLDMVVSESSNHTLHTLPSGVDYNKIGDFSVSVHKMSLAWQVTTSAGPVSLRRESCGGPFAGVSLTAVNWPLT